MADKQLQWGQTPFDECTREELIQHCARLYSATSALSSVAGMLKDNSGFWKHGTGGEAVEMGRQALELARNGYSDENICRAHLRYAGDFLFADAPGLELRSGWILCPDCGHMMSSSGGPSKSGVACNSVFPGTCVGVLRDLSWDDLQPKVQK
jgi:hypothetical protein